jgi:hypothetical protein
MNQFLDFQHNNDCHNFIKVKFGEDFGCESKEI